MSLSFSLNQSLFVCENSPGLIFTSVPPPIFGTLGNSLQRSEEHTSELQSPCNLVCRLLLAKKHHSDPSNCVIAVERTALILVTSVSLVRSLFCLLPLHNLSVLATVVADTWTLLVLQCSESH